MKIPIQNIYYLLCYAWNKLAEADLVKVTPEECRSVRDLLGNVLANGVSHLLKQGLDRGYIPHQEKTSAIRGKIMFTETLKRTYFKQPYVYCEFDELSYNILHNQIIKTMLDKLCRSRELNQEVQQKVEDRLRRLPGIDVIPLNKRDFGRVQLHSNNSFYTFLLHVCELLFDSLLPTEQAGETAFRDFEQDEVKMRYLFENFIRNFYKINLKYCSVNRRSFKWDAQALGSNNFNLLGEMMTDVSISTQTNEFVIETKFSFEALTKYYSKESIRPGHIDQLCRYLRHTQKSVPDKNKPKGILLYPTVKYHFREEGMIEGFHVVICTINLNQPWRQIHDDLVKLIQIE